MNHPWRTITGIVIEGYRVASGTGKDQRYPTGTLSLQKPFFAKLGLDLSELYDGTLNLDIRPFRFALVKPAFTFKKIEWTSLHPPEDFSFCRSWVSFNNSEYPGWIYMPHPETKADHFQSPCTLEVITQFIPHLKYGDSVKLQVNSEEVTLLRTRA